MMMVEENWKILLLGGGRRIVEDIYLMHFILLLISFQFLMHVDKFFNAIVTVIYL